MAKYNQLAIALRDGTQNGVTWKAELFCIEVGARGTYHEMAWGRMCKTLGFTGATRKALLHAMQDAAIQCSHFIFLCRSKKWDPKRYETHGETLENLSSGHCLLIEARRLTV